VVCGLIDSPPDVPYLGEACAIAVLQDMRRAWNESFAGFQFRKFDGTLVTI
jgi:hypothetical protein